ncbi:hypothetical protein Salat_1202100 [Sesamum alatum]|uniref:Uncharacterized protein n=1 Tax=Sesamum alatum TaxID=300844 RepID=A0AAE2CNU0_9LAMI|nr:hypothetical protein Salat_1202100 [Sesamum alatum]
MAFFSQAQGKDDPTGGRIQNHVGGNGYDAVGGRRGMEIFGIGRGGSRSRRRGGAKREVVRGNRNVDGFEHEVVGNVVVQLRSFSRYHIDVEVMENECTAGGDIPVTTAKRIWLSGNEFGNI